jgi:hypothetical protein
MQTQFRDFRIKRIARTCRCRSFRLIRTPLQARKALNIGTRRRHRAYRSRYISSAARNRASHELD